MYLVRYGEITLKSERVRRRWEHILMRNIEAQTGGKAVKRAARILVIGGNGGKLSKVFGVKSYSPVVEVPADLERVKEKALEMWRGEKSFAVRARRVTKDFPLTSMDINREVGAYVKEKTGMRVDLENPELTIGIEIIGKRAYIFRENREGPGGLPVGVSGRAVVLLSPGFDSPIAAWYVARRGVEPVFLHANMGALELVKEILRRLSEWLPRKPELYVYDHASLLERVLEELRYPGDVCLACKAIMYRQAERLAQRVGAHAIVTGETIGQVASQTLPNMAFLSSFVRLPILRPLVGFDKDEIMEKARYVGTYDVSSKGSALKCRFFRAKPATRPKEYIRGIVERLELPEPSPLDVL